MIVQFCGLSGSGKTTLARAVESKPDKLVPIEVIDGDEYRETLCKGLGFAKEDRFENMRRMAFVAGKLAKHGIIPIICAINPYQEMRNEVSGRYPNVKTIYIDCRLGTLKQRDTKGLYARAELPNDHPCKLGNLTGISDPFDVPAQPDLHINTSLHTIEECTDKIGHFILQYIAPVRIIQHNSRDYYYRSVYR
jgi:adenylylsulfate kinase